jgi:hypothetical protein
VNDPQIKQPFNSTTHLIMLILEGLATIKYNENPNFAQSLQATRPLRTFIDQQISKFNYTRAMNDPQVEQPFNSTTHLIMLILEGLAKIKYKENPNSAQSIPVTRRLTTLTDQQISKIKYTGAVNDPQVEQPFNSTTHLIMLILEGLAKIKYNENPNSAPSIQATRPLRTLTDQQISKFNYTRAVNDPQIEQPFNSTMHLKYI